MMSNKQLVYREPPEDYYPLPEVMWINIEKDVAREWLTEKVLVQAFDSEFAGYDQVWVLVPDAKVVGFYLENR